VAAIVIFLFVFVFLTACVQCAVEGLRKPKRQVAIPREQIPVVEAFSPPPPPLHTPLPPKRRSTVQIGAVTCEVVQFEEFDLIHTSDPLS
jgi:hypothetical protein